MAPGAYGRAIGGLAGALAMLIPPPSAVGADDRQRLRRHAPILVHDPRERDPVAGVESSTSGGRPVVDAAGRLVVRGDRLHLDRRWRGASTAVAYGRVSHRAGGGTWLQYWLFYLYNSQDRGVTRTGRHQGDWEFVQIGLNRKGVPDLAVYGQHERAERCRWAEVARRGDAPVVYVANGSHASHFRPGRYPTRWFPDPVDEADGRGRVIRPPVHPIRPGTPRWLAWPGRWGASWAGPVPGEQSSPRGPAFQPGDRWRAPNALAARASPCSVRCDAGACTPLLTLARRQWPLVLFAVLLAIVVWVVRKRSPRR